MQEEAKVNSKAENRGDITIEKTVITIKGGSNNPTSTDRHRVILSDKVRKEIEESQALVQDLLESNRRNTD